MKKEFHWEFSDQRTETAGWEKNKEESIFKESVIGGRGHWPTAGSAQG